METAADRFLNDSFPAVYPVETLPEGEDDLGVRRIDFDARLPQDPSKTFTPGFLKDIPDSASLVSYRIELTTGRIFPPVTPPLLLPRPTAGWISSSGTRLRRVTRKRLSD